MTTPDLTLLVCPMCRRPLSLVGQDRLRCEASHEYPIVHGIPELLPPDVVDQLAATGESKRQERQSHDEHAREHDLSMPVDGRHLFSWLNYYQLFDLEDLLAASKPGRILVAMCGSGFELELWATLTHQVSGMDISTGLLINASDRARKLGLTGDFVAADIEHIPFGDGSFDLVVVHHGLHHLEELHLAVGELLRVSRHQCLICEPVDGPMRRLLRRTGVSPDVEPGGTQVRDIAEPYLRAVANENGADVTLAKRLFYRRARAAQPTGFHRWADSVHATTVLRPALKVFNVLFGAWLGTKGTFMLTKRAPAERQPSAPR